MKGLEESLASQTSSLSEAENDANVLKGDLERLTVALSQTEIVKQNYVRQLLLTAFQKLLSSEEYKQSLSEVFNQAIATRWSEGVKVGHSKEDAKAILADATDYDPECKTTFMSAFDSLFTRSYPYVEKLAGSLRLPLGDLQNMWPEGEGPTVAYCYIVAFCHFLFIYTLEFCFALDLRIQGNIVHHFAIGTWTHPERIAFREIFVAWPLALALIQRVLHFEKYLSLSHWRLDLSGAYCISRNIRHLAIGAWTHPERIAFREIFVT
ncbi:hypothetical protein Tco_0941773 [Tanacetum coccineum]|uniref:Uncharacterized protein n=1 Tax=Tanacetum coccineum TaxID=301880 RepID=A0ABQ5DUJ4_9ASTR